MCMKVFLKHQVNWNTVRGTIRDLPWRNIWLADNPVLLFNKHLSMLVLSLITSVPLKAWSHYGL